MGHKLTALSLAATVESLRRAGMGRVVVGVLEEDDVPMIKHAFRYVLDAVEPSNKKAGDDITKIGHMEVGYAFASTAFTKTNFMPKNMPRATLMTLRDAMKYTEVPENDRSLGMAQNITAWLGTTQNPSYWQYIYLTEPDSILQTRQSSLKAIKAQVDMGAVVLPHRWQNLPHESDVRGMSPRKGKFLTEENFPEVLELNPTDVCCDENAGRDYKPGVPPYYEKCNTGPFWYLCGFDRRNRNDPNRHDRITKYGLIRFTQGSGIATIAGSNHGRRCFPKKGGVCLPKNL
ncbi:expressed unknown protein [Seminavis robusta]|uniref:Uncharacterized protein n=1 Tax=Seminavis robusta TaxID=568900 RepID=A0A9N8HEH5_9STRA|nr:expressed unknown protein [Seminavis robusta]|eukprot:Sro387_g132180.1 n/a (289) ;mRNA; f:59821-60687